MLKQFLDSQLAWNVIQAAVYNDAIAGTVTGIALEIVEEMEPPAPGSAILEVGCGDGRLALAAAERFPGVSFTCVDYSESQIRAAKKALGKKPHLPCEFMKANAMDLPFEDDTFDMAISVASIKHWPDPAAGLREMSRALKPGARALIGEADREFQKADLKRFIKTFKRLWWVNREFLSWYVEKTVFGQSLTPAQAEKLALAAGFAEARAEKVPGWPFFRMELVNS